MVSQMTQRLTGPISKGDQNDIIEMVAHELRAAFRHELRSIGLSRPARPVRRKVVVMPLCVWRDVFWNQLLPEEKVYFLTLEN